nr:HDOD domain-containing protein [uncultured Glaciecola sp.]
MPLDIIINSIAITGLILVLYLYRMSKKSTIATKKTNLRSTSKDSYFTGIGDAADEPTLILRNPKDIPDPSEDFINFVLLEDIVDEKQRKLFDSVTNLKKPHPLLTLLTRNITDPKELLSIIKNDPELVVNVIKVANSSLFALRKSITTINHAIVYLGVLQAKNIAMQFALERSSEFVNNEQKQAYQKIWKASFLASSIGLLIAKDMKLDNSAELSTRCLLDYLGDLSLLNTKPKIAKYYLNRSTHFNRVKSIQKELGTNTAIMGKAFAENAQLPDEIIESIGASMLPMVNKLSESTLSSEQQTVVIFSYYVSRITDLIIFERRIDNINLEEISFAETISDSFFYSQAQIEQYGLSKMNITLRKSRFRQEVGSLIEKLGFDS